MSTLPITIGPLSDLNSVAKATPAPYLAYSLSTAYDVDSGEIETPVAGPPGTPPEIIAVHAPFATKTVIFLIVRLDGKAQLPDPRTGNPQERFLGKRILGAAPGRLPDGSAYVVMFGEYRYALTVTPGPQDTLYFGTTPIDISSPAPESLYNPADFIQGIISAAPTLQGIASGGNTPITKGVAGGQ